MTLESVRVMGAGVVVMLCVQEVMCGLYCETLLDRFILVPCSILTDPNNGTIICSLGDDGVPSYGDTCTFTCNTGYELTGSNTRTCQSDGSWSGSDVVCTKGNMRILLCTYVGT